MPDLPHGRAWRNRSGFDQTAANSYILSMQKLIICLFCLLLFTPTYAKNISGENYPRFQTALNLWLDGEDLKAVKQLGTLAKEDNTAA